MSTIPAISFSELRKRVETIGFQPVRQKGSHIRYQHVDGRKITIPDHGSKTVPKGLFSKIVRYDIGMDLQDFLNETGS